MKTTSIRRAFTLVELLVVIAIIGVLMGLTIPAVQAVRASARQTTCLNNEKQIAIAALSFETTNGFLPYHVNTYNGKEGNWVVPLLPHLGETALWNAWGSTSQYPYLSVLVCPDNSELKKNDMEHPPFSYAANCGNENQLVEKPKDSIYLFWYGAFVPAGAKRSMTSKMQDGSTNTALFAERYKDPKIKTTNIESWKIISTWVNNEIKIKTYAFLWNAPNALPTETLPTYPTYPTSAHPQKGFNLAFADGGVKYLGKNIIGNLLVYSQLLAPNDEKASKLPNCKVMENAMDMKLLGR